MVADVQGWLDNPATNFGWLMLGDESAFLRQSGSTRVRAPVRLYWPLRIYRQGHRHPHQRQHQPQPLRRPQPRHHTDSYTYIHAYSDRDFNSNGYSDAKIYASARPRPTPPLEPELSERQSRHW